MIAELSAALLERGNVPAVISTGHTPEELENASQQLLQYRAEATVFLSGSPPASLVDLTRRNGQTLILINRAETGVDNVRCDDQDGTEQAFEALRMTGAQRFALITPNRPSASLLAREQTFSRLAAASGVPLAIVRSTASTSNYEDGREAVQLLLEKKPAPDAVFCVNDLMALGALDGLREADLAVPDDVSVIGFDDIPMAAWDAYRLTTLRQDPARVAREVVGILDRRAADPDSPPMSVRFPVDLIVRETVRGLR